MIYNDYVKYEEPEIHRFAIMQDFRDNGKKNEKINKILKKIADWRPFWIFYCEICHGLSLCETLHFVLYSLSSHFAFLELSKYNKIQNGR